MSWEKIAPSFTSVPGKLTRFIQFDNHFLGRSSSLSLSTDFHWTNQSTGNEYQLVLTTLYFEPQCHIVGIETSEGKSMDTNSIVLLPRNEIKTSLIYAIAFNPNIQRGRTVSMNVTKFPFRMSKNLYKVFSTFLQNFSIRIDIFDTTVRSAGKLI